MNKLTQLLAGSAVLAMSIHAAIAAEADQALIEQGKYVATAADCSVCHTSDNGKAYTGGRAIESPFGAIYSTNITPDKTTGIGRYTLEQFDQAVRHGKRADGANLYPAMPYTTYGGMSDEDLKALYAYFMHGVKPVTQEAPETDLSFPFNQRWGITFWNWMFDDMKPYTDTGSNGNLARGKYLVDVLGHCSSCHTPRGMFYQEKAITTGDDDYLSGADIGIWHAPNIRAGNGGGLAQWSNADIQHYLQTGRNQHTSVVGEMTPVVAHSFSQLTDEDVAAVATYLKTLDGKQKASDSSAKSAQTTAKLTAAKLDKDSGERLYVDNCGACHFVDAKGGDYVFPELDGNSLVNAENPAGLIHVILAGARLPSTEKAPERLAMPGFGWRLEDKEVAALASFIRQGWGNNAGKVTAKQVADVRATISDKELQLSAPDPEDY